MPSKRKKNLLLTTIITNVLRLLKSNRKRADAAWNECEVPRISYKRRNGNTLY